MSLWRPAEISASTSVNTFSFNARVSSSVDDGPAGPLSTGASAAGDVTEDLQVLVGVAAVKRHCNLVGAGVEVLLRAGSQNIPVAPGDDGVDHVVGPALRRFLERWRGAHAHEDVGVEGHLRVDAEVGVHDLAHAVEVGLEHRGDLGDDRRGFTAGRG